MHCGQPLDEQSHDGWHDTCVKKFFGSAGLPFLDLTKEKIEELAQKQIATKMVTTGVQKKLSIALEKSAAGHRLTLTDMPGGYILKPQTLEYAHMPECEFLTMLTARVFKIDCVPFALIHLADGSLAHITRRVDRSWPLKKKAPGHKIAMEDFCQLSGTMTENKYRGSHEQCGKIISRYSSQPGLDKVEFFTRIVHAFLTGNNDMHLKNFSLIHRPQGWVLSPAYDLINAAVMPPSDKEELALTLNGKKTTLRRKNFLALAANLGIAEKTAQGVLMMGMQNRNKVHDLISSSWLSESEKNAYEALYDARSRALALA